MKDTPASKACTKCGEVKYLDEFNLSPRGKPLARCKECTRAYNREYRKKNRDLLNRKQKERVQGNPERLRRSRERAREHHRKNRSYRIEYSRRYYRENKGLAREYARQNKDRIAKRRRVYLSENRDRIREVHRYWASRNADWRREYRKRLHRSRWVSDPSYKMRVMMREHLRRALDAYGGKKTISTREALGYSSADLVKRMEVQFSPGMSWDNYGDWHIDHKIPVARFLDRGETRPHIINALSNLQPMWAEENMRKGARWIG